MALQVALVKDDTISVNRCIWGPDGTILGLPPRYRDSVRAIKPGLPLFFMLRWKKNYAERDALSVRAMSLCFFRPKFMVCHKHGVMHRDLKPENFLFANKKESSPL